ncbi:MAG: hypothetical protein J6D53_06895 [Blautia sp.]|nr:hypothetical protein [Blautia sp.]
MDDLIGKTIKEAEVDGFGIRIVFTNGAVFEYSASDGGYSQYELTEATADAQTERKKEEIDRIESAIRHIQTATDVDPWATEIAVDAMRKQIPMQVTAKPDAYSEQLLYLYCPTCRNWAGIYNSRVKHGDMYNTSNRHVCPYCGQRLLLMEEGEG